MSRLSSTDASHPVQIGSFNLLKSGSRIEPHGVLASPLAERKKCAAERTRERRMALENAEKILEGKRVQVRKLDEKFDCTRLLADDEWYPRAVRRSIRP